MLFPGDPESITFLESIDIFTLCDLCVLCGGIIDISRKGAEMQRISRSDRAGIGSNTRHSIVILAQMAQMAQIEF